MTTAGEISERLISLVSLQSASVMRGSATGVVTATRGAKSPIPAKGGPDKGINTHYKIFKMGTMKSRELVVNLAA